MFVLRARLSASAMRGFISEIRMTELYNQGGSCLFGFNATQMLLETLVIVLQALHFNWPLPGSNPKRIFGKGDSKEPSTAAPSAYKLHTVRLGVWEIVYASQSRLSQLLTFPTFIQANIKGYIEHVPLVVRFFQRGLRPCTAVGCVLLPA